MNLRLTCRTDAASLSRPAPLSAVLAQPSVKRLLGTERFWVEGFLIQAWASIKRFSTVRSVRMRAQRRFCNLVYFNEVEKGVSLRGVGTTEGAIRPDRLGVQFNTL